MKRKLALLIISVLILRTNPVSGQSPEIRFLIDTCVAIMEKNAINPNHFNLEDLKKNALAKAAGITDAHNLGPVMRYLYGSLNDFHGAFTYMDSTFRFPHKMVIPDSVMEEWKNGTVKFKTRILSSQIGYLDVPDMNYTTPEDANRKAKQLNDSLCFLLSKNIKGLIIDVRANGGGAMFPMILGVKELLGDAQIGSFQGTVNQKWFIKDNKFFLDAVVEASLESGCDMNAQNIPVVLLVGSATRSSGEFFLMAFRRRQKTILLGSPTEGYITSVQGFQINEKAFMMLSTGYGADRNGTVYKEALKPDVFFEGLDNFNHIENDEKVKAAVSWLENNF
jgi:carboxyl-terminal processing protease